MRLELIAMLLVLFFTSFSPLTTPTVPIDSHPPINIFVMLLAWFAIGTGCAVFLQRRKQHHSGSQMDL
ncbi:MAG: hypothetical protein ACFFEF_03515 [Candidatus Thorarchaeota archaeon]